VLLTRDEFPFSFGTRIIIVVIVISRRRLERNFLAFSPIVVTHEKRSILRIVEIDGFLDGTVEFFIRLLSENIYFAENVVVVFECDSETVNSHGCERFQCANLPNRIENLKEN